MPKVNILVHSRAVAMQPHKFCVHYACQPEEEATHYTIVTIPDLVGFYAIVRTCEVHAVELQKLRKELESEADNRR